MYGQCKDLLFKYVTLQVVIYVDDVNDNSPSFPSQVAQLTFSEGSTPGKLKRESVDESYTTVTSPSFPSQVPQLTFSEGSTPGKLKRGSVDKQLYSSPSFPS
jgi:hypothetical protein